MKAFDSYAFEKHGAEAKEKWGQTAAYREFETKTKEYTKDRWNDLAQGMDQIIAGFALCMKNGAAADSVEAQNLVKCLQNHITENYYPCTDEILAGLGQMYVADERFQNNMDRHGDGTAQFVCQAIGSYCGK